MKSGGRVLSVASECVPLIKTGGLADVVGALPGALAPLGWEMIVLLPCYRALKAAAVGWPVVWHGAEVFGGAARVLAGEVGGVKVLLLEAGHLYDREGGPYAGPEGEWPDNAQRFAALSWVAAEIARDGLVDGWRPDVLHCHDWQAGFAPAYAKGFPSVMTVHNIAFQGWAPASMLADLRLPVEDFHSAGLEYYGGLSSLKAGLINAHRITTVSPNYAAELMRPEFGMGLEGVIAARADVVSGILNGVDEAVWSPEIEPLPFSAKAMKGKALNRAAISAEFGLTVPGPLAILVSRLTDQKGIDLVAGAIAGFVAGGGGLIVLGSGDAGYEAAMLALAVAHPGRVAGRIGHDGALSHRLVAGADAGLGPRPVEPCGLTQMYGLRYGTLPLVSAVGGLWDTVIDASPAALAVGAATGVVFHPVDALAFAQALQRLLGLYANQKVWVRMQKAAMAQPVGWQTSARAYAALYQGLRG